VASLTPGIAENTRAVVTIIVAAALASPAAAVTVGGGDRPQVPVGLRAVGTIGEGGRGDGQFNEPTDVALDATGRLYVVDSRNVRVQRFFPRNYTYT
jgi:hypothetical protein